MRSSLASTTCAPSSEPMGIRLTLIRSPSFVFANSEDRPLQPALLLGPVGDPDLRCRRVAEAGEETNASGEALADGAGAGR